MDGFTYSFNKGKVYLITGFSGCGKSTLANVIAGLYPSSKGILSKGEVKLLKKKYLNILLKKSKIYYDDVSKC